MSFKCCVGGFAAAALISIGAAFAGGPPPSACCYPWDNGRPDGNGGQSSQIGVTDDWRPLVGVSFDDFWLCEGQVHHINAVSGTLNVAALIDPKAIVVILPDCNGLPDITKPLAVAGLAGTRFDVDQEDVPFILGRVELATLGPPDGDGYRPIGVTAVFDAKGLALKGGAYWITIFGVSANLNPLDEFFWAKTGGSIKGRPGVFFDGDTFRTADELCCGCTDYNFCVQGESCKILLDNGLPSPEFGTVHPLATPSLQNGSNTQTKSRAADKVVFPPCTRLDLCYVEGWMWTNCDRIALQIFRDDCHCPNDEDSGSELLYADCVMETEITATDLTGQSVTLKKAQWFFDRDQMAAILGGPGSGGRNLWFSLVGQGDNRQNARAYFAYGFRCDRPCDDGFGCFRAAPFATSSWRSNDFPGTSIRGNDYALLVAVREGIRNGDPGTVPACPADVNNSGEVTVQDLFDFLAAYFAGCP
jgi:hypothetical protein